MHTSQAATQKQHCFFHYSVESLAVKTPLYATLVALVKDETDFVSLLVEQTKREMARCVTEGCWRALKLLTRFVAALVDARVLRPAAFTTLLDAFLALAAAETRAHADALYTACLLLFWSTEASASFRTHATRVLAAATDADAAIPALAAALAVLRDALAATGSEEDNSSSGVWRTQQSESSFLSLRPFAPFAAAAGEATVDFGELVLPAQEATVEGTKTQLCIQGLGDTVRAHVAVLPLCEDAPVLGPLDAVLYADSAHDVLATLLDDPPVCARHLAVFVPVAPRALAAFDAHLACVLLSVLVATPDALTRRDARLLAGVLARILRGAGGPGLAALVRAARTACLARIDTLDPRAVARLAACTAVDICDTRDPAGWNAWNETLDVLHLNGGGDKNNQEETPKEETPKEETLQEETPKEETPKEETPKVSPATQLFIKELLLECCTLDEARAFVGAPGFPRTLTARCPATDGTWPAHLRTEPASQRLLSRLATTCAPAELEALAAAGGGPARVADCVVRVCAMSYLNCVHLLNVHRATLAAAAGSTALLASVRRCCARAPLLRFLLLDKMTTADLITLPDVINAFLPDSESKDKDDGDDKMTEDETSKEEEKEEATEEEVPWDVLDMVVEKCVAVHSPAGAHAVARCREYAQRIAATDAYAGSVAASYAAHWELLLL